MNDTLNELNVFACGLNVAQKNREAIEAKIWELILKGSNEK